MRPRRFTARYDSECENCTGLIVMGDEVAFVEDVVWCDDCLDQMEEDDEVTLDDL